MTSSILLRPHPVSSSLPSPTPSPSPISTPLPGLQPVLTSSSSSSPSGSCPDLHRAPSAIRRIRFAPLPEPNRDLLPGPHDSPYDAPQSDTKCATHPGPSPDDPHDGFVELSPSISPDSTGSSARSTPTIRLSLNPPSKNTQKSNSKLLRPFAFFRRAESSHSSLSQSTPSLLGSRNASFSSLDRPSSSVPNSPSLQSSKLPRISEDIVSFGRMSLFRDRAGSSSSARRPRASSPPPKNAKSHHRSTSTSCGQAMKPVDEKCNWEQGSIQSHESAAIIGSSQRKRRASSLTTPGAGGGRHTSAVKILPSNLTARPNTAPSSISLPPKRTVKMLNGRIYGAKRYAAQTLANPFANVRDEPEFVEWGYGGMGSVHASAGIANDMWKGLQRSEHGSALLAGPSFGSPPAMVNSITGATTAGGGRGSETLRTSPNVRRKMSDNVPECGMGNVGAGGGLDEDDGSGMAWVKRRRAEREAKARFEQDTKELDTKMQERRKSGDSLDASMYASTASTTTSLTACTSAASTELTTPTTTPLTSRSPSIADLKLTSSPSSESHDLRDEPPVRGESTTPVAARPTPPSKDEHEHRVLTAIRLSPKILSSSHKHERSAHGPVGFQATRSTDSSDEEELEVSDEEEEQDDDDERVQDVGRKTALGAGVEKISRHLDAEAR